MIEVLKCCQFIGNKLTHLFTLSNHLLYPFSTLERPEVHQECLKTNKKGLLQGVHNIGTCRPQYSKLIVESLSP